MGWFTKLWFLRRSGQNELPGRSTKCAYADTKLSNRTGFCALTPPERTAAPSTPDRPAAATLSGSSRPLSGTHPPDRVMATDGRYAAVFPETHYHTARRPGLPTLKCRRYKSPGCHRKKRARKCSQTSAHRKAQP